MSRPTSTPKSAVSSAVTRMRESLGFTMEELASRLKVSLNTVSRWENSRSPTGSSLEKLYRYAKKNGPAASAERFLRAIESEKAAEHRRYRLAQILDAGNLHDVRTTLRELWEFETLRGSVDPFHDPERREYLLRLADFLCHGRRKELLGDENE